LLRKKDIWWATRQYKDVDLLIRFLKQGNAKLSERAKTKEFGMLTADEVGRIEAKYSEIFQAAN